MNEQDKKLNEIRALVEAATPGPWMWDIRACNHDVKLVTTHSGRYYVMGVQRWGTQGACVSFQVYDKYEGPVSERGGRGMHRADKLSKSIPGKEHHEGWDDYIDHPDAKLIAAAPEALTYTLDIIARQDARIEALEAERDAAEECLGFVAGCLSTISKAKAYIKPGTGVWHTVGLALERIEQWREARFREGGGEG